MSRTLGAVSSETSELPEVTTTFGVSGYLALLDAPFGTQPLLEPH